MAYDSTNPTDVAALKALVPDPTLPTQQILDNLNDPALNIGGETGANIFTARVLIDAAWDANVASGDQFKVQLLIEATQTIEDRLSEFRARAIALSTQLGNAINASVRALSVAEVAFGDVLPTGEYEEVQISRDQWIAARDS